MREPPDDFGMTMVYALAAFYGVLLGLALAFVLTLLGWWP